MGGLLAIHVANAEDELAASTTQLLSNSTGTACVDPSVLDATVVGHGVRHVVAFGPPS